MLVRDPKTCFTSEELFETLLKFAHRSDMYDLESDDFKDFGEELWEKLSVDSIRNMVVKFGIEIDVLKIEQEIIDEFKLDTEDIKE